jgi:hypothetical protein
MDYPLKYQTKESIIQLRWLYGNAIDIMTADLCDPEDYIDFLGAALAAPIILPPKVLWRRLRPSSQDC